MPKVTIKGKVKHFAYTPEGIAAAKKESKKKGAKMMMKKGMK